MSKQKKGKKKQPGFADRHRFALIVAGCSAAALIFMAAIIAMPGFSGADERWVYVPRGATQASVADTLRARLGSSLGNRVYWLWRAQGGTPERAHGAYLVTPGTSAGRLSRNLASGRQTPIKVTFPGTRTMEQMASKLTEKLEMSDEAFLGACRDILPDSGFTAAMMPAAFIPDTYEFYWTVTPQALVQKLLKERNSYWTPERVAKARAEGLTPAEVAVVASIIEEETAKADELPVVARLYLNRLHRGMRLQADPTVKYAVGDPSLRRITGDHLKVQSPYNTYLHAGLPPGPIRIAERGALEAVLHAPVHNYIYMCAREDFSGHHNFTSDYGEHQRNAARYQEQLNRRNIR